MMQFILYNPEIRQDKRGGGFTFTASISENQWSSIREVNNPINTGREFTCIVLTKREAQEILSLTKMPESKKDDNKN